MLLSKDHRSDGGVPSFLRTPAVRRAPGAGGSAPRQRCQVPQHAPQRGLRWGWLPPRERPGGRRVGPPGRSRGRGVGTGLEALG